MVYPTPPISIPRLQVAAENNEDKKKEKKMCVSKFTWKKTCENEDTRSERTIVYLDCISIAKMRKENKKG